MTTKEKMLQARQLIQEKKYSEAQKILRTVDHPAAKEWLAKLDGYIEPKASSTNSNRNLTIAIGGVAVILIVILISVIFFRPRTADTVSLAADATHETVPTSISTAGLAYENRLDNPIPVGQPIQYNTGRLQVLDVHYPIGFALYSDKNYAPLIDIGQFIGIRFAFSCVSTCEYPPEAKLSLVFTDGSVGDRVLIFSLQKSMFDSENSTEGWVYFHLPTTSSISALHVANEETSLFASLPKAVDGYLVDTSWETVDRDTQRLRIPKLRRLLADQYAVQDINILSTKDVSSMYIPITLDDLYFENKQAVIDMAFPIITTVSSKWDDYREEVDGLNIVFLRSTDNKLLASVIIISDVLEAYSQEKISTDELVSLIAVDIQETPPQLGSAGTPTQVVQVSTSIPNTSLANTVNSVSVPKTLDGFKQYLLTNYSSIAGQALSVESIDVNDTPFRSVSIYLTHDEGGWETFANQTRSAATEYADHLLQDVESFFGSDEDILVTVSYSYYTDRLRDYHYNENWWYIGDYNVDHGWYVSMDFAKGYFRNGSWDLEVWNYK